MPDTLHDWLERIERAHPQQIELGLERTAKVAARLGLRGLPPAIVVAGTNGKGSCVAVLDALLRAQGVRTGVYVSPHLRRYNERVRVDGQEASDAALCAAFAEVERARGAIPLTYFEFGTLAALVLFREAAPDRLLLEVGLGGRLDAVNIIDAEVAVVTSIQLDHTDWLGSDRESIGREKAGVFRGGRPCVVAERDSPASLRATASAVGARWYGIGDAFDAGTGADGSIWWRGIDASGARVAHDALPAPRLHLDNVAAALQALALCGALPAVDVLVRELPAVGVEGRYDRRSCAGRECILDVAHNPAGMDLLRARLARDAVDGRTVAVVGAMRDKDLVAMLGSLAPAVDAWYFVDLPEPRAASAAELVEALARARVDAPVRCEAALHTALDQALAGLGAADRMVVCGSFHTVGPALDWIEARNAVHGGHS